MERRHQPKEYPSRFYLGTPMNPGCSAPGSPGNTRTQSATPTGPPDRFSASEGNKFNQSSLLPSRASPRLFVPLVRRGASPGMQEEAERQSSGPEDEADGSGDQASSGGDGSDRCHEGGHRRRCRRRL